MPGPDLSINFGIKDTTDGGYPFAVGCSPSARPISLLAWATLRQRIHNKQYIFFLFDLKYSAIAVALIAPRILSRGDLSAGTATTMVLVFAFPERIFFDKTSYFSCPFSNKPQQQQQFLPRYICTSFLVILIYQLLIPQLCPLFCPSTHG